MPPTRFNVTEALSASFPRCMGHEPGDRWTNKSYGDSHFVNEQWAFRYVC